MRKFVENLSVFVEIIWKLTLVILILQQIHILKGIFYEKKRIDFALDNDSYNGQSRRL